MFIEEPTVGFYDQCVSTESILAANTGSSLGQYPVIDTGVNTQWTTVFLLNGVLYICMIAAILLLFCGTFFFPFWFCGCCTVIYGNCGHLAALIVTGVFRYQSDGANCAKSTVQITNSGITFQDHGNAIEGLFIA